MKKQAEKKLKETLDHEKYQVDLWIRRKNPLASKKRDLIKSLPVVKAKMIDHKEVSDVMK